MTGNALAGHWIAGASVAGEGRRLAVTDPATGEPVSQVTLATEVEVQAAVDAAAAAADTWGKTSTSRRTGVLFRFADQIRAHRDDLAAMVTSEHGKTLEDAAGEVARGLENVEHACGLATQMLGSVSPSASTGVDVWTIRQPLGVVAGITPFNFPVMVPLWMTATALAAGNAIILKPSEKTPSAPLMLAEMLAASGLPAGAFTVLQGDRTAVDSLLAHPRIAAVSFVGSTPVARHVYETGTRNGKRVQALGGAKNHMIVLPDADLDLAADAAVSAGYGSAGQRCMAISVVVAVGTIADELVERIAERVRKLRVGPGTDSSTDVGPVIDAAHQRRVLSYLEADRRGPATVVVDGRTADAPDAGSYVGPSLLDNVQPDTPAYDDEIFGPVLGVVRAGSYDEALDLVNSNPFGNGAAIFTRDGGAARHFADAVQAGMVGINVPIPVPVAHHSFGGWKASLFGDSHMYGPEGFRFYTRAKVVTTRWPDPATSTVDLGFPRSH